ncbi:tetratricopeptide repeat protein [Microbacterium sp. BH-3-3-3]|uniref:tetratricopeptide repeat protein n=1 Tax=Microbacterium sp. BH-3-3-3 TaxID=1906742 RepID=UPI0016430F33|nr:tetratricopeptide repeat protein [Microbacterium sp. BH-3-3-3]
MDNSDRNRRSEVEEQTLQNWEERAKGEYERGDYRAAEISMRAAVEFEEADASTYFNLGQILYNIGDYVGAIEAYGKSIGNIDDALINRGLCWEMVGDFGSARQDYLAALEGEPGNVDALVNLGTLELGEGNLESAKKYLVQAVKLDEKCNWQLADVFVEAGDLKMAASVLEKAVESGESRASSQLQEVREQLRRRLEGGL